MFPICYVWSTHRREGGGVTERDTDRDRRRVDRRKKEGERERRGEG